MKKFYNPEDKNPARPGLIVLFILILSATVSSRSNVCFATGVVPVLVSSKWLEENRTNKDLVILHVSSIIRDYDNGHIPGAGFLWPGWLAISTEKETTVPADFNEMKRVLERLGVTNKSHIVLCGYNGNLVVVCRIFVTLSEIGLAGRVSILDGGFENWKSSGMKISIERPEIKKGSLMISKTGILVDADWMIRNLTNKAYYIIDARAQSSYDGTTGIGRMGHIPGARNLPATDLYNNKSFQFASDEKINELFNNLEIPQGTNPVFYCQSGNIACVDYVAALIAGYCPVIYDGSMEDWASRLDMPLENN